MSSTCKNCGECAYDHEDQVCKACGVVCDDIQFGSEFNVFGSNTKPKLIAWTKKQDSAGLAHAKRVLDVLCNDFGISSHVKEDISKLLEDIYATKSFARKHDVAVLAGCCLMYEQKKHNEFVSVNTLSAKLNCPKKKVFQFMKVVKQYTSTCKGYSKTQCSISDNISQESNNIETPEMLESLVNNLLSAVQENKSVLIEKTLALTKLANSCWVGPGRSTEGVVTAAAYLCWKSIHPHLKKLTLKHFCSDFSLPCTKAQPRVSELKVMLLKLGNKIPSPFSKSLVNEKNILFHLNYILQNSETLRNNLLKNEFTEEEIAKKEFSTFRKSSVCVKRSLPVDKESKYEPDMCASDIEISDSEISSYIRSEKEVSMIKKLKEKYSEF